MAHFFKALKENNESQYNCEKLKKKTQKKGFKFVKQKYERECFVFKKAKLYMPPVVLNSIKLVNRVSFQRLNALMWENGYSVRSLGKYWFLMIYEDFFSYFVIRTCCDPSFFFPPSQGDLKEGSSFFN